VLSAQTHHLARDQQVHASQMMLIEKNSAAIHASKNAAGQQGHRQERALSLPGKRKDSVRVVTQILQEPVVSRRLAA
jgi:transcription initiation factor IIF auxiliary subunit